MFHVGEWETLFVVAKEIITDGIAIVIAAVVNVAAIIQLRVQIMRNEILRPGRPATIFGALKDVVIGALGKWRIRSWSFDASVRFDEFFIPPPDVLRGAGDDDSVVAGSFVTIIATVECHREVNLFEVAQALGLNGSSLSSAEGWQKHRGQDCDDGDDDEQFDEREGAARGVETLNR